MLSDVTFYPANCFHKHDKYNLIYKIIYLKKTVQAYQCQKCRKYLKTKQQSQSTCKKNTYFFWFLFGDFNISNIFY